MLALAISPLSWPLFYQTRLFPAASLVVLALLLLGNRGLVVGVVGSLVAMLQWHQPLMLVVGLAELLWLKLYLDHVGPASQRRDNGWIVLADILFWVLFGVPLAFLLFGVVMNLDPASVLNLAIRQGINGSINAILGFFIYILLRLIGCGGRPGRPVSIRGLTLITLLMAIVLPAAALLSLQSWQRQEFSGQVELERLRQSALTIAALERSAIPALMARQREHGSLLELRLLRGDQILLDSNPGLFRTLESHYISQPPTGDGRMILPRSLDLIVPQALQGRPRAALRGYWRYRSALDLHPDPNGLASLPTGWQVLVVEPARSRIQQLEEQSTQAQGILSWIVLIGALLAESGARAIAAQFPAPDPDGPAAADQAAVHLPSSRLVARRRPRSRLRELDRLLRALRREQHKRLDLRQRLWCSENERNNLQEEVSTLSIRDPLTGCYNKAELYRRLDLEVKRSYREQRQLSLQWLEIDHLRPLHDSCGSSVAEEVLRRVAAELLRRTRSTDLVCRVAEDQFAVLLPSCEAGSAQRVAQLLCDTVARLEIQRQGIEVAVTLSVGLTALRRGQDDIESLINRAENALYRAKAEGRNRVVLI
jgi:diguanylate cyclase (GGDEF)-like protein